MRARWMVVPVAALLGACGAILGVSGDDATNPPAGGGDGAATDAVADADFGDGDYAIDAGGDPNDASDDVIVPADAGRKEAGAPLRVFASSKMYVGSALANANAVCATLAASASLGGSWVAWLSYVNAPAPARFAKTANGPWYLVDGTTKVASTKSDLVTASLANAIAKDEQGTIVTGAAWTGTLRDGGLDTKDGNCGNWSVAGSSTHASYGNTGYADFQWTEESYRTDCTTVPLRIYCFEQP